MASPRSGTVGQKTGICSVKMWRTHATFHRSEEISFAVCQLNQRIVAGTKQTPAAMKINRLPVLTTFIEVEGRRSPVQTWRSINVLSDRLTLFIGQQLVRQAGRQIRQRKEDWRNGAIVQPTQVDQVLSRSVLLPEQRLSIKMELTFEWKSSVAIGVQLSV
jgi:hypothetical protein